MKDLPALVALYDEINAILNDQMLAAGQARDPGAIERVERKQRMNDQAYFVLCWGQLEDRINEACRAAISMRRADPAWSVRRAWDLYNPHDRRLSGLSFEDRAAMVVDRQGGPGSPWARLQQYYALRNQIAHGKLHYDRIDVTNATQEFYRIESALVS